ncbi:MAG: NAD(P)-binding domain-containing protein, partial [Candidatus Rokuibacteriota bacterium]
MADRPIGFVGLGAMGGRMARRLLEAGYPVVGYNRT